MKDKQKMKVIVVVAIAIAVVFGVLLIAYCICNRKNLRGNVTFFDPLWKKYQGKVEKLHWLLVATPGIFSRVFLNRDKLHKLINRKLYIDNNNNKKTGKYIKFTIAFYEFSYFEIVA